MLGDKCDDITLKAFVILFFTLHELINRCPYSNMFDRKNYVLKIFTNTKHLPRRINAIVFF